MEMTEIRKSVIGVVESHNQALASLAEQAKSVLGYDVLSKLTTVEEKVELSSLQQALKDLDIEVLNADDVELYKKERLVEQTVVQMKLWLKEENRSRFMGPDWESITIDKYREPIPEFVIAKAVQIKQAL